MKIHPHIIDVHLKCKSEKRERLSTIKLTGTVALKAITNLVVKTKYSKIKMTSIYLQIKTKIQREGMKTLH